MQRRRIHILNGHPAETSLSKLFAGRYGTAATKAGHDLRITHLQDLHFDLDFGRSRYTDPKPMEPDLRTVQDDLRWAEHVVLLTPMWWGGVPAKLKGVFDRVLLPGIAFDTRGKTWLGTPKPLLTGRTARLILTSDTPDWFLRVGYGNALIRQLRRQVFGFVGISPMRVSHFSGASTASPATVETWSGTVAALGSRAG